MRRRDAEGSPMKSLVKSSLVAGGAAALVLAGTVNAFAGWTARTSPAVLTVKAATVPPGPTPAVVRGGRDARLDWEPSTVAGTKVKVYVVTRVGSTGRTIVCDHVSSTNCRDRNVPDGTWTWRVRPILGTWAGTDGPDSAGLTFGPAQAKPGTTTDATAGTTTVTSAGTTTEPTAGTTTGTTAEANIETTAEATTEVSAEATTEPTAAGAKTKGTAATATPTTAADAAPGP
jgi:hypothetical protein